MCRVLGAVGGVASRQTRWRRCGPFCRSMPSTSGTSCGAHQRFFYFLDFCDLVPLPLMRLLIGISVPAFTCTFQEAKLLSLRNKSVKGISQEA